MDNRRLNIFILSLLPICGWLGYSHWLGKDAAQNMQDLLAQAKLEWHVNTTITAPGDPNFAKVSERWTTYDPPTFSIVVSPASEADVVQIVKFATTHHIPFLATGGRHGYTTSLGKLRHGLAIDLSLLNSVEVMGNSSTLAVGGGTRWGQILDPIHEAGFEMPTGSCSCPGVVGATIGGGVGRYSGRYGMISDSLISAHIVTADGRLVEVSENSHSDLFWGIRGAGANFGILTRATYKLHRVHGQNLAMNADVILPAEKSDAYFDLVASYDGSMPEDLAIVSIVMYDEKTNAAHILVNWVYFGPEEEGLKAIAPLLELQPSIASIQMVPWNKIISSQGLGIVDAAFCQNNKIRNLYSANVRRLSAPTLKAAFQKMQNFYAQYPSARGSGLELETFPNQAATAQSSDSTAYPWRDTRGNMIFLFQWEESGDKHLDAVVAEASTILGRELRNSFSKTSGYPHLSVYISYSHGDESWEQVYSQEKLPRLAALKKEWDPDNVFAYNNALPTEYPLLGASEL